MEIKNVVSWGFGNDSTYLVESLINQGRRDFIIISSDPGNEEERTYKVTIPFYKPRWEKLGLEVIIIDRGYKLFDYFFDRNQVPLGHFNPLCSSHFKRDLIRAWFREQWGKERKTGVKYLAGNFIQINEMIGHTLEEKDRCKYPEKPKWLNRLYPNYTNQITKDDIKRYWIKRDLPEPKKSACWFCPNKPLRHFKKMRIDEPNQFKKLLDLEANAKGTNGKPAPTLKREGSLLQLIVNQGSLLDFDFDDDLDLSELNCSSYCYT